MDPYHAGTVLTQAPATQAEDSLYKQDAEQSSRILDFIFITEIVVGMAALIAFSFYFFYFQDKFLDIQSGSVLRLAQGLGNLLYYLVPAFYGVVGGLLSYRYRTMAMQVFFIGNAYALLVSIPEVLRFFLGLLNPDHTIFTYTTLVLQVARALYAIVLLGLWQRYRKTLSIQRPPGRFMPFVYRIDMLACIFGFGCYIFMNWQIVALGAGQHPDLDTFSKSFYISTSIWSFFWDFIWLGVWMLVRLLIAWLSYYRIPAMILFCTAVALQQIFSNAMDCMYLLDVLNWADAEYQSLVKSHVYFLLGAMFYNALLLTLILVAERKFLQKFLVRLH